MEQRSRLRIVGVIDLRGGQAVHARGGDRRRYAPLGIDLEQAVRPGDAFGVAAFYRHQLGLEDVYVADLDAIEGGNWQSDLIAAVAASTSRLWLDAGITSVAGARRARSLGASQVVVGLETLPSYAALRGICDAMTGDVVAFSLDLRGGAPVTKETMRPMTPEAAAAAAADTGIGTLIVLDLTRVGCGAGCDLDTIAAVRRAAPDVRLFAGGGIGGPDDLRRLAGVGCDGVLVASALCSGALQVADSWLLTTDS